MGLVLKSISFNTDGDAQLGSLHCRRDADTPISPAANIQNGDMPVGVFVPARLGVSINVEIEVENTEDQSMNVSVSASEITTPLLGDLAFPGANCPARSVIRLSAMANTANLRQWSGQLRCFQQQWKWRYTKNHMQSYDLTEMAGTVYVIPDLPALPWNSRAQQYSIYEADYIWTGILDICCNACVKYSRVLGHMPAAPGEYIEAFAYELNSNPSFRYDTMNGASYYSVKNGAGQLAVKLKKYLKDRQNLYNRLNCTDCATLVQIESRACGIEVSNAIMTGTQPGPPPRNGFLTNPILAIGYTDWAVPFSGPGSPGGFSYHEITAFDNTRSKDTLIYDACLQVDNNVHPSKMPGGMPPYQKNPLLPCGIAFAETNQHQVVVPLAQPYAPVPNCYRERLVSDGQFCNLVNNVYTIGFIDLSVALQMETVLDEDGYLDGIREKYGLEENPLPEMAMNGNVQKLELLEKEPFLNHCRLTENYGRSRVYQLDHNHAKFRLEVTFALNEREAYAQLVCALACISNPNICRAELGDAAFAIGDAFYLFVKNNVLVRFSRETEESAVSAEPMAHIICNSL